MKIIHVSGGGNGGAKTHILALCKHLGIENNITLVSLNKGEFARDAQLEGIHTQVFHSHSTIVDFVRLASYIKKEKPDVVHCHGAKANLAGIFAKIFCKGLFTTTVHSDYKLDYMHSFWRRQFFGRLNSMALRFFDYYVSVSDSFKKMLITRRFVAHKIMPIYNGLDFSEKCPPFDRCAYLRGLGLDFTGDEVVLGIAARLTPVKDIPTLLYAFAKAYESNQKLRLLIGGDGDSTATLKNMAEELGIASATCFCGWVDNVAQFFAACDIDVLCSISESFPYSILEGVREGCAVISSDVGGVSNMIKSGVNGFVFQSRDVDTFAQHILTLSADEAMRKHFAKGLFDVASNLYSIENMARRQAEIYRDMLELKSRKGRQGVIISGAYGRGNSGDEAILQAIISTMRKVDPLIPITVMTRNPEDTRLLYNVSAVYTFNIPSFSLAMLRNKLFISGGGSLIQNVTSTRSLLFYLSTIFFGKVFGCKVLMYGCGIGQVHGSFPRWMTQLVIHNCAHAITVRDSISQGELKNMGITRPEILLSADPAMCLESADELSVAGFYKLQNLDWDGKYICFSLRKWKSFTHYEIYAQAARYAYEKYGLTALFLPIEVPRDVSPSVQTAKYITTPYKILDNPADVPLIIGFLKRMDMVCAVRLHALVFAASAGVPFVATSYDVKVSSFMQDVGKPDNSCDISTLTTQWLCDAIDRAISEKESYREISHTLRMVEQTNSQQAEKLLKNK